MVGPSLQCGAAEQVCTGTKDLEDNLRAVEAAGGEGLMMRQVIRAIAISKRLSTLPDRHTWHLFGCALGAR